MAVSFPCAVEFAWGLRPSRSICGREPRLHYTVAVSSGQPGCRGQMCLCEFRGKARFPPRSALCGSGKRSKAEFADGFDGTRITIGKRCL